MASIGMAHGQNNQKSLRLASLLWDIENIYQSISLALTII
jgi:hypothetical protein